MVKQRIEVTIGGEKKELTPVELDQFQRDLNLKPLKPVCGVCCKMSVTIYL